ncbi:MAG: sporulation protein YqfD [Clostridia bacterium]|nr:sporulation protein YqfD [Clostridia bacterium]
MRIPLFYRLLGYHVIKVEEKSKTRLENLLFVARIPFFYRDDGAVLIPHKEKERLKQALKRERLSVSLGEVSGFPCFLRQNLYRIGIPIGALFAALLIYFGSHTVWQVCVSGTETVSPNAVVEGLASLGFGVGSATGKTDFEALSLAYRLQDPSVAWMGIYTHGTTAYVKVIENKRPREDVGDSTPSHLVATTDAVIVQTNVLHGQLCVKAGDVVRAGDMLVLGFVKGAHGDVFLQAEGSIKGRISESFSIPISVTEIQKTESRREKIGIELNFFGKVIKIFEKTPQNASDYVIINRNREFLLPTGKKLPFSLRYTEALLYTEDALTLSESEALLAALDAADALVRQRVGAGELLKKDIKIQTLDGEKSLLVSVEYTKDIAEQKPISLGLGG